MAEQMGTPGSTADTSVNGGSKTGGAGAPKDKACPFCHQQFTSSSLGRHLDLYIKEKNPKPPDGVHDVEEIKVLRKGITRRQPRNSTSKREDSTPPAEESNSGSGNASPSVRREEGVAAAAVAVERVYGGKPHFVINKPSWEATGVMNVIPPNRNGNGEAARSWDGEDRDAGMGMGTGRKVESSRNRSVSKQMLAKTTFEQKQKMMDALDNAKAAELALRELLGSIRAAK